MTRSVCIIQGHPHRTARHFCHAIAETYESGARAAGAQVTRIDIAALDFPVLQDPAEFALPPPPSILDAQKAVADSDHLVVIYPLWLGTMPALVKAFFEQLCRAGFAISADEGGGWPRQMLKGKSARVIVTMGMPASAYRVFFGAHGVKSMESGILGMAGVKPVRETLIGGVGALSTRKSGEILRRIRALGQEIA